MNSTNNASSDSFFECDVCGTCFSEKEYLVEHNSRTCIDQSQSKHQCYTCKKGFSSDSALNTHLSTVHLQMKDFECTVCGRNFGRKCHLDQHVLNLHSSSPRLFACDICGYSTPQRGSLTIHARLHTGEKRFKCRYCEMLFNTSSDLKRHLYTHTSMPLVCEVCGRGCQGESHLKLHMRVHTAEKPFVCTTCGKGFSQRGNLSRHVRTHTGEKPHQCSICEMRFSRKRNMMDHIKQTHKTNDS